MKRLYSRALLMAVVALGFFAPADVWAEYGSPTPSPIYTCTNSQGQVCERPQNGICISGCGSGSLPPGSPSPGDCPVQYDLDPNGPAAQWCNPTPSPVWSPPVVVDPPVYSPPVYSPPVVDPPVYSPPVYTCDANNCPAPNVCTNNMCSPPPFVCGPANCAAPNVCQNNQCVPPPCGPANCPAPGFCNAGVCQIPVTNQPDGSDCSSGSQCASGNCGVPPGSGTGGGSITCGGGGSVCTCQPPPWCPWPWGC